MEITFKGNGIVWNPIKNRKLCRFESGEYTTSDHDEIAILRESFDCLSDLDEYDKRRKAVERSTKSRAKRKAVTKKTEKKADDERKAANPNTRKP